MGRLCYLCNYNERKRDANISLHSFPKIPITRSAWFHVCGLNEEVDDVSGIKICSQHFLGSDFFPPRNRATKRNVKTLRPGAVPSIMKVQSVRQTALRKHVASTSYQMDDGVTIKSQDASDCEQNLLQEIVKEEADDCAQQVDDIKEEEAFSCDTEQENYFSTGVFQKADVSLKADPYIQYVKVEDDDGETCLDTATILQGYWDTEDVDSTTKSQPYTSNL